MVCKNAGGLKRAGSYMEKGMAARKRWSKETNYTEEKALIVDNIIQCRVMQQAMLVSLGIHTLPLNTAQEALQILAVGVFFNYILVDFDLPITNGPESVSEKRGMGIESKIVGICMNYDERSRDMFMEAGADVCMGKPTTTTQDLWTVLQQLRNC